MKLCIWKKEYCRTAPMHSYYTQIGILSFNFEEKYGHPIEDFRSLGTFVKMAIDFCTSYKSSKKFLTFQLAQDKEEIENDTLKFKRKFKLDENGSPLFNLKNLKTNQDRLTLQKIKDYNQNLCLKKQFSIENYNLVILKNYSKMIFGPKFYVSENHEFLVFCIESCYAISNYFDQNLIKIFKKYLSQPPSLYILTGYCYNDQITENSLFYLIFDWALYLSFKFVFPNLIKDKPNLEMGDILSKLLELDISSTGYVVNIMILTYCAINHQAIGLGLFGK